MEKALISLGLTETEAKVYLALLKRGSSLAGKITRETGLHRRTVYDTIERLIEKGLVSYITTNNQKYFEAVNPERLMEILKEKETLLQSKLNDLKALHKSTKEKKQTLFFRGSQSLKYIFDDMIKESKEILLISKCRDTDETLRMYFTKFNNERINKKINLKVICSNESEQAKKFKEAEVRTIKGLDSSSLITYVYGNNVSLVILDKEPMAILIRQSEISEGFRNYFDIMWNIAQK